MMPTPTRTIVPAWTAVLLAITLTFIAPPPAVAGVSKLCTGYAACARADMSDAGYGRASGTMYWRMYSGHNCTNYVAYRIVQSGLPNVRPWTGGGNATYWGTSMMPITDGTPAVGSVAWWKAGVYPAGSAGHVAYVEKVVSADEIIVSQDSWGGDFSWARVTRGSKGWPSGFIHFNDVPLLNSTRPAVSGTPRVGALLSATPGTWSPSDASVTYQWRAWGVDIPGANGPTFVLPESARGKRIRVVVTAAKLGHPTTTARSAATAVVRPGVLASTTPPAVTGEPLVDSPLTASPGTWDPVPDALDYQWLADGAPLAGADEAVLTPDAALVGKTLSVRVTARKAGYAAVPVTSPPTAPVAAASLVPAAAPTLSGATRPGQVLTLDPGAVTPAATPTVRWLRGGVPLTGVTGTTYALTADDLGARIRAVVTWSRPGYTTLQRSTRVTPRVKSVPTLEVETVPTPGGLRLTARLRAQDGTPVPGVLRVRSRARLLLEQPLADGSLSTRLTSLPVGTWLLRFVVPATATVARTEATRTVRIG